MVRLCTVTPTVGRVSALLVHLRHSVIRALPQAVVLDALIRAITTSSIRSSDIKLINRYMSSHAWQDHLVCDWFWESLVICQGASVVLCGFVLQEAVAGIWCEIYLNTCHVALFVVVSQGTLLPRFVLAGAFRIQLLKCEKWVERRCPMGAVHDIFVLVAC